MNPRRTRGHRLTGIALVLALLLVGCGSDSDEPETPDVSNGLPLSVEGLVLNAPTDEVSVVGSIVVDATGTRLCAALAESFPPQCGGAAVTLINLDDFDVSLEEEQGVRWSDPPVVLTGTYRDRSFTITALGAGGG